MSLSTLPILGIKMSSLAPLLAATGLVFASACDGEPESAPEEETGGLTNIELEDAACPNLGSCTANDVVTTVVEAHELGGDDCADGSLDVEWTFRFATTATERYDLGVFIATDGVSPKSSDSCVGVAPQPGDGDPNSNPDGDADLFQSIDTHGGADTCGDLSTAQGPVELTVSATVACNDVTPTGEITVPSCRVWQQNANHKGACTNLAFAGTGSKCDCDPIVLHVDPCSLVVCNDGQYCNGEETCDSSSGTAVCHAGTAPSCDDGVGCTADSCNEADDRCDHAGSNAGCDDGLYCNGQEVCDPVNDCQAGTPVTCGDDGASCTAEVCNEDTDACELSDNGSCGTLAPEGSGCVCFCGALP